LSKCKLDDFATEGTDASIANEALGSSSRSTADGGFDRHQDSAAAVISGPSCASIE